MSGVQILYCRPSRLDQCDSGSAIPASVLIRRVKGRFFSWGSSIVRLNAVDCRSTYRGFESHLSRHARVAQRLEQFVYTEKVAGSSPALGTILLGCSSAAERSAVNRDVARSIRAVPAISGYERLTCSVVVCSVGLCSWCEIARFRLTSFWRLAGRALLSSQP